MSTWFLVQFGLAAALIGALGLLHVRRMRQFRADGARSTESTAPQELATTLMYMLPNGLSRTTPRLQRVLVWTARLLVLASICASVLDAMTPR